MWYSFVRFWARLAMLTLFRIRVFGRENIPPSGAVVLASNHQSFLDPALVIVGIDRQINFMARKSLFERFRPFGWLIASLKAFPVSRHGGEISAIREALRRLKKGSVLLAFPEGTRTFDGRVGPFKEGLFMMAARVGAVVVPTVVDGAYEVWPRGRLCFRPGTVYVGFAPPIASADFGGDTARLRTACREAVVKLHREMAENRRYLES